MPKITISQGALDRALTAAGRAVESRTTMPILSNLRLSTDEGRISLTGTDLDIQITTNASAEVVGSPATTTIPARLAADIVKKLPKDAEITLEWAADDTHIALRAGRARFRLATLPAEDFPDLAQGDMTNRFSLGPEALERLFGAVEFAISTEESRYYLNGIYLHPVGQRLTAVATDGHRLARAVAALPAGAEGAPGIIIPRKTVGTLLRLLKSDADQARVSLSASKICFETGETTITSKLIDGTFPDYTRVIPANNPHTARLDLAAAGAALGRVGQMCGEKSSAVRLAFAPGQLALSVQNSAVGEASEDIAADYAGTVLLIGFNHTYLAGIFAALGSTTVEMALDAPGSPTIISSPGVEDLITVLMPMRV